MDEKKIDNFNLFPFEWKEWEFYFFSIIKRKKDNPNIPWINWNNHMRLIKSYSIYTQKGLEKYKQEMINIAEITNSRIYMHPTRRSENKVRKLMLQYITENIILNKHNLSWLYNSVCWWDTFTDERYWIVDIDIDWITHTYNYILEIQGFINNKCMPYLKNKIIKELETINWYHLITTPFNIQEFKNQYPDIDIHKNNPTLIYFKNKDE